MGPGLGPSRGPFPGNRKGTLRFLRAPTRSKPRATRPEQAMHLAQINHA